MPVLVHFMYWLNRHLGTFLTRMALAVPAHSVLFPAPPYCLTPGLEFLLTPLPAGPPDATLVQPWSSLALSQRGVLFSTLLFCANYAEIHH